MRRSTMHDEDGAPTLGGAPFGRYANYFEVGHNECEFLLDFGQFYPEGDGIRFHTRIITGPTYAKALLRTLLDSLRTYERTFGAIE